MSVKPSATNPAGFELITPGGRTDGIDNSQRPLTIAFTATTGLAQRPVSGAPNDPSLQPEPPTTAVTLTATQPCFYEFGPADTVTATTGSNYLPANFPSTVGITPGSYIAAIRASGDGTLYISQGR